MIFYYFTLFGCFSIVKLLLKDICTWAVRIFKIFLSSSSIKKSITARYIAKPLLNDHYISIDWTVKYLFIWQLREIFAELQVYIRHSASTGYSES